MSFQACAEIVKRGDPDRFLAVMTAPQELRGPLFAVFAFNVEVARAPWVSQEATINEIRLQWWQDALAEIAAGGPVRRHEVVTPLSEVIGADEAAILVQLIEARKWDVYDEPFFDNRQFDAYLEATAAGLMWVAARSIGVLEGEAAIRDIGYATGLEKLFKAVPELISRGKHPLPQTSDAEVQSLAQKGLLRLGNGQRASPYGARFATRSGWQANRTLRSVAANPAAVMGGWLHNSEFTRRTSLLWHVARRRW